MPNDFIYMNSIISGIFLFGVVTLLLTISYLGGVDEIDDFDEFTKWEGPTMWLPPEGQTGNSEENRT